MPSIRTRLYVGRRLAQRDGDHDDWSGLGDSSGRTTNPPTSCCASPNKRRHGPRRRRLRRPALVDPLSIANLPNYEYAEIGQAISTFAEVYLAE